MRDQERCDQAGRWAGTRYYRVVRWVPARVMVLPFPARPVLSGTGRTKNGSTVLVLVMVERSTNTVYSYI
eukprot:scaffold164059_cov14-Prasinocladus_malaysianus.AAC.1